MLQVHVMGNVQSQQTCTTKTSGDLVYARFPARGAGCTFLFTVVIGLLRYLRLL